MKSLPARKLFLFIFNLKSLFLFQREMAGISQTSISLYTFIFKY